MRLSYRSPPFFRLAINGASAPQGVVALDVLLLCTSGGRWLTVGPLRHGRRRLSGVPRMCVVGRGHVGSGALKKHRFVGLRRLCRRLATLVWGSMVTIRSGRRTSCKHVPFGRSRDAVWVCRPVWRCLASKRLIVRSRSRWKAAPWRRWLHAVTARGRMDGYAGGRGV